MDDVDAQTPGKREIVNRLDREFVRLHLNSRAVIESTGTEILYTVPDSSAGASLRSVGENVLRSAAIVEQTFGGITANLWDDPFEWTLPEYLSTPEKVIAHLAEVELTRERAFSSFADDASLHQLVALPSGENISLLELLRKTLKRALEYQSQSLVALKILSGITPPGFII
jgi:hypothetical protein